MARRSSSNPHPEVLGGSFQGVNRLRELEGWDRFTWDMKRFLVVLPVLRQRIRAARVVGRNQKWLDTCRDKYGWRWKKAIEQRLEQSHVGLDLPYFQEELWSIAIIRLEEFLFSENEGTVLKTIELLGKIQGTLGKKKTSKKTVEATSEEPFEFTTELKEKARLVPPHVENSAVDPVVATLDEPRQNGQAPSEVEWDYEKLPLESTTA
jgi:hypothetical protein